MKIKLGVRFKKNVDLTGSLEIYSFISIDLSLNKVVLLVEKDINNEIWQTKREYDYSIIKGWFDKKEGLVKEKEDSPITLIKVAVESDHCLFIQRFDDPTETEWKLKKDQLADIIECLSDEAVKAWESAPWSA